MKTQDYVKHLNNQYKLDDFLYNMKFFSDARITSFENIMSYVESKAYEDGIILSDIDAYDYESDLQGYLDVYEI